MIAAAAGEHTLAALLLGAADGPRERLAMGRRPDGGEDDATLAQAEAALGAERARAALEEGRALSLERALGWVEGLGAPARPG